MFRIYATFWQKRKSTLRRITSPLTSTKGILILFTKSRAKVTRHSMFHNRMAVHRIILSSSLLPTLRGRKTWTMCHSEYFRQSVTVSVVSVTFSYMLHRGLSDFCAVLYFHVYLFREPDSANSQHEVPRDGRKYAFSRIVSNWNREQISHRNLRVQAPMYITNFQSYIAHQFNKLIIPK